MSWLRIALLLGMISLSTFLKGETQQNPDVHEFYGKHFIASYSGCDHKALTDLDGLVSAMQEAATTSGATIVQSLKKVFPPDGLTMVILLAESHASIHTYPEYNACFVDLFTCGSNCVSEKFDRCLQDFLKPTSVNMRVLIRHQGIEDTD